MTERLERFENHALGRPFHAALLDMKSRSRMHGHRDYYEVMAVTAGVGEHHVVTADGDLRVLPLRGGDVVLVRPRDRHAILAGVRFYNVAFPATTWRAFAALANIDAELERAVLPPHTTVDDDRAARACAQVLERFHGAPSELDLIRFWTEIVPLFAPATSKSVTPGVPGWLTSVTAAMADEDNLREGVPRLLALAHVSAAHLARSMRRYHHMTPSEFVADLRLRHAAMLLATTTRPIADIAHSCGYVSPSYFSRCFRDAHGLTPRQFRYDARHAFVPS